jgi:hypothetical protein
MPWHIESPPPVRFDLPPQPGFKGLDAKSSKTTNLTFPDHWWDERHWKALQEVERYRPSLPAIAAKLPPPDPTRLSGDIDMLKKYQDSPEREKRRPEILEEANSPPPYYEYALFLDDIRRPLTRALFYKAVKWAVPFIMHFKHDWKYPRPSQVDPAISPMIACPNHPAYPSGHSTQAHLIALVVGRISGRDDVRDVLRKKADRIAENREYAGLHYPSDSACGAILAQALLPLFETEHAGPMAAARQAEWDLWPDS